MDRRRAASGTALALSVVVLVAVALAVVVGLVVLFFVVLAGLFDDVSWFGD